MMRMNRRSGHQQAKSSNGFSDSLYRARTGTRKKDRAGLSKWLEMGFTLPGLTLLSCKCGQALHALICGVRGRCRRSTVRSIQTLPAVTAHWSARSINRSRSSQPDLCLGSRLPRSARSGPKQRPLAMVAHPWVRTTRHAPNLVERAFHSFRRPRPMLIESCAPPPVHSRSPKDRFRYARGRDELRR